MKKIGLTQEVEKILEEAKLEEVKKKLDGRDDDFYSKNKLVEIGEEKVNDCLQTEKNAI